MSSSPPGALSLVIFLDERPYTEFLRRYTRGVPLSSWGFYSRGDNWLVLFDFRNVPVSERGAGLKNMRTLAHETTHLLAFNTGLLNRNGDTPRASWRVSPLWRDAAAPWPQRARPA